MEFLNFDELEAYKKLLSLENAVALPSLCRLSVLKNTASLWLRGLSTTTLQRK